MKSHSVFHILSLLFVLASCGSDAYFDENVSLENSEWSRSDEKSFEFKIEDTISRYDFILNLRNTTSYPFSNMYIFTTMKSPTLVFQDTIAFSLADPSGQWLGKSSGSMVENHVMFMKNVRFKEVGDYELSFRQGMRSNPLPEVSDVGLTINKVE